MAAFNQFIVVYQWQQIYTKTQVIEQIIQVQSDKLQSHNNNKDNQYQSVNQGSKKEDNQVKVKKIKKTFTYTKNGFLVENVVASAIGNKSNNYIGQNKNSNKLSISQNMSQLHQNMPQLNNNNNNQGSNTLQQKQYFLQIWNTQSNNTNASNHSPTNNQTSSISPTNPTVSLTQPLSIHKTLYPFVQGKKLTIIIQPSYQYKKRNKLSSLSIKKQQKQKQKQKQKCVIRVYDFSQWLKGNQLEAQLLTEQMLG